MSGRFTKTYSRKKAAAPPISQFDALVTEQNKNTTRPTAAKTAGHFGKWGTASFTSLRGINGSGKVEEVKADSPPAVISDDPFTLDIPPPNGSEKPPVYKKRKFFKSRAKQEEQDCSSSNVDSDSSSNNVKSQSYDKPLSNNDATDKNFTMGCSDNKIDPIDYGRSKDEKTVASSSQELMFDEMMSKTDVKFDLDSLPKPGIKLKIFKSRNEQSGYLSAVEIPSVSSQKKSASKSSNRSNNLTDAAINSSDDSNSDDINVQSDITNNIDGSSNVNYKNKENLTKKRTYDNFTSSETTSQGSSYENYSVSGSYNNNNNNTFSNVKSSDSVNNRVVLSLPNSECDSFTVKKSTRCYGSKTANKPSDFPSKHNLTSGVNLNSEFNNRSVLSSIDITASDSNAINCESSSPVTEIDTAVLENLDSPTLFNDNPVKENTLSTLSTTKSPLNSSPSYAYGNSTHEIIMSTIPEREEPKYLSTNLFCSDNTFDLFGTDFDENEIVDRTKIDYRSSNSPAMPSVSLDDLESSTIGSSSVEANANIQIGKTSSQKDKLRSEEVKPANPPPITKKRSIFKSRTNDQDTKKRATYKHKWHDHEDKDDSTDSRNPSLKSSGSFNPSSASQPSSEFDFDAPLQKVHTWHGSSSKVFDDGDFDDEKCVTKVKCSKEVKQFYTVIQNVKRTHQLQESGEFQEFNDDVDYFLDALRSTNSTSTRCLAAFNLAQKCMVPAFRMHLRAHGTVIKFFKALNDAPNDTRLALSSAMVMFALSQDRLNMDLDRNSLELMLNLLDTDTQNNGSSASDSTITELNLKIQSLCKELQKRGHAKHLKLDKLNAGTLAMETLLSLTSKRAGEWFKEELRDLGGVDHLILTVSRCTKLFSNTYNEWNSSLLEKLSKVDRCLKVLENVTHQNDSNQEYLLTYDNGLFANTLMSLYTMCHNQLPLYPENSETTSGKASHELSPSQALVTTLVTTMKILINLTHSSQKKEALGSQILGGKCELYQLTLHCLLIMPVHLSSDKKFELLILACCLLLNLVEHSKSNRKMLLSLKAPSIQNEDDIFSNEEEETAMEALVKLFYKCEESAREQEAHTDNIIDHDLDKDNKDDEKTDDIEETVAKLLQKAGRHMEDTLIAAYTALLAGYCIMDDKECQERVREMQPDGHFKLMVTVLKKFLHFMNLTATTSLLRSLKPTENLVKFMERLDKTPAELAAEERLKEERAKAMTFDAFGF